MENNNIMKKMLPLMIGAVVIITGVIVASILMGGAKSTPWGNVSNNTYYSYNGYTVSEREWYDKARYSSYSYFINLIDSRLIDVDALIQEAKDTEYTDDYDTDVTNLYLKFHQDVVYEYMYGTIDREQISYMSSVEKDQLEREYYDNLSLVGIDTNDYWNEEVKERYKIEVAKRMYTLNYFKDQYTDESDEENYITADDAQTYWEDNIKNKGTVNALFVTFGSSAEYEAALSQLNAKQVGSVFYNKTTDVPLTDLEVRELFVDLYGLANYNYDGITEPTTDGIEYTQYDINQIDTKITTRIFDTLSAGQYSTFMTGTTGYYAAYKMTDVVPAVAEDDYDGIVEQMALNSTTASLAESVLSDLRADADIVIYDPVLESFYKYSNTSFKTSNKESDTNIATVNGKAITVDEFYSYIEKSVAIDAANDVLVTKVAKDEVSDTVDKDDKDDAKDTIKDAVSNFKRGSYNSSGFDSNSYGEDVFLAVAFGATDLDDAVSKYIDSLYVNNFYTEYDVVYGDTFYDNVLNYMNIQYEQYFKFAANEFVIYIDLNRDGTADDFQEAIDEGKINQTDAVDFANALMKAVYLAETNSENTSFADALNQVVSNYNSINMITGIDTTGSVNNLYDYYKKGFKISTGSSTTYSSISSYSSLDEEVYQGLLEIYNTTMSTGIWSGFDEDTGASDDGIPKFITSGKGKGPTTDDSNNAAYNDLIVSEAGIHLYIVGQGYEKPTFEKTDASDFNLTADDIEFVLNYDEDEDDFCEADDEDADQCIDEDEYDLINELYGNISSRLRNTYQKELSYFNYINGAVFVKSELNTIQANRVAIYKNLLDDYETFPTSVNGPFYQWFDKFTPNI